MRTAILCFCIMFLGVLSAVSAFAGPPVTPTPLFMDVYGFSAGILSGDVVTAVDGNGVVCGQFTVKKAGQYGFLHVYGDDPSSAPDEGAVAGETVTIKVNGEKKADVAWAADSKKRLDF